MGKWIVATLIFVTLIAPLPLMMVIPDQPVADLMYSWFVPKDKIKLGRSYIDDVRHRAFQPVARAFAPQFVTPQLHSQLSKTASVFPNKKPLNIKVVGAHTKISSGVTTYNLSYEYQFPRQWMLAGIILHRGAGGIQIYGLHVQLLDKSLEQLNALTFDGKPPSYYLIALAALLLFVFWVVSVYVCLFTPMARHKWLWVVFVILGFMSFSLNWTTGHYIFTLLDVSFPPMQIAHSFYAPWYFNFALPLGAIVFWFRRHTLLKGASS